MSCKPSSPSVGIEDGSEDGEWDGTPDAVLDGPSDGAIDGVVDGAVEGIADPDGCIDGMDDGMDDGALDGSAVSSGTSDCSPPEPGPGAGRNCSSSFVRFSLAAAWPSWYSTMDVSCCCCAAASMAVRLVGPSGGNLFVGQTVPNRACSRSG